MRRASIVLLITSLVLISLLSYSAYAACCYNQESDSFCQIIGEDQAAKDICCPTGGSCYDDLYDSGASCTETSNRCQFQRCCERDTLCETAEFENCKEGDFQWGVFDCYDPPEETPENCLKGCCLYKDSSGNTIFSLAKAMINKNCIDMPDLGYTAEFQPMPDISLTPEGDAECQVLVPQYGTMSGIVRVEGTPTPGVEVTAAGETATTDDFGYYAITDVPFGTHPLTAAYTGYKAVSVQVTIPDDLGNNNIQKNVDITETTNTGSFKATVHELPGPEIVSNAVIIWVDAPAGEIDSFAVDQSGIVTITSVPAGEQTFKACAQGYEDFAAQDYYYDISDTECDVYKAAILAGETEGYTFYLKKVVAEFECGNDWVEATEQCDAHYDTSGNKIAGDDDACPGVCSDCSCPTSCDDPKIGGDCYYFGYQCENRQMGDNPLLSALDQSAVAGDFALQFQLSCSNTDTREIYPVQPQYTDYSPRCCYGEVDPIPGCIDASSQEKLNEPVSETFLYGDIDPGREYHCLCGYENGLPKIYPVYGTGKSLTIYTAQYCCAGTMQGQQCTGAMAVIYGVVKGEAKTPTGSSIYYTFGDWPGTSVENRRADISVSGITTGNLEIEKVAYSKITPPGEYVAENIPPGEYTVMACSKPYFACKYLDERVGGGYRQVDGPATVTITEGQIINFDFELPQKDTSCDDDPENNLIFPDPVIGFENSYTTDGTGTIPKLIVKFDHPCISAQNIPRFKISRRDRYTYDSSGYHAEPRGGTPSINPDPDFVTPVGTVDIPSGDYDAYYDAETLRFSIDDTGLLWNHVYEYKVVVDWDGTKTSVQTEIDTGDALCAGRKAGDELCLTEGTLYRANQDSPDWTGNAGHDYYIYELGDSSLIPNEGDMYYRVWCNEKLQIADPLDCREESPREDVKMSCIGPDSMQKTKCEIILGCEEIGTPSAYEPKNLYYNFFGMYYEKKECIYKDSAKTVYEDGTQKIDDSIENREYCYYDYSGTLKDKCFNCDQGGTCFGYKSADACLTDNCAYGQRLGKECGWQPMDVQGYDYWQLGKGLCYEPDYRDTDKCSMCGPSGGMFSNVGCTPTVCRLLGACLLQDEGCEECSNDRGCEVYEDKESCEGIGDSASQFTIPEKREGICGSDTSFIFSDDSCGKGRCRWDEEENSCFKDGDDDNREDCKSQKCRKDFTAPVTNLASTPSCLEIPGCINNAGGNIEFTRSAGTQKLYYCFDDEDTCCPGTFVEGNPEAGHENDPFVIHAGLPYEDAYPLMDLSDLKGPSGEGIEQELFIRFYAIDENSNVEEIKSYPITVDTKPPLITITHIIEYTPETDDLSDLSLNVETDERAECSDRLQRANPLGEGFLEELAILSDAVIEPENPVLLNYPDDGLHPGTKGLRDGRYHYEITCIDSRGNEQSEARNWLIDRNKLIEIINPAQPATMAISSTEINLEFRTKDPNYCRYREVYPADGGWIYPNPSQTFGRGIEDGTGSFFYRRFLDIMGSGSYNYYIECYNDLDFTAVTDEASVMISVDITPPETTAYYMAGGKFIEIPEGLNHNWPVMRFSCTDQDVNPEIDDTTIKSSYPEEFGCGQIRYCVTSYPETCAPDAVYSGPGTLLTDYIPIPDKSGEWSLCYSSPDMGGNEEGVKCKKIVIDRTGPSISINSPLPTKYTDRLTGEREYRFVTNSSAVAVSGVWSDESGVAVMWLDVTNASFETRSYSLQSVQSPAGVTTAGFSYMQLPLDYGPNEIMVGAADPIYNYGYSTPAPFIIYRDDTPPTITSPQILNHLGVRIDSGYLSAAEYNKEIMFSANAADPEWSQNIISMVVDFCSYIESEPHCNYTSIELYEDGTTLGLYTNSANDFTPETILDSGDYSATFRAKDRFGNEQNQTLFFRIADPISFSDYQIYYIRDGGDMEAVTGFNPAEYGADMIFQFRLMQDSEYITLDPYSNARGEIFDSGGNMIHQFNFDKQQGVFNYSLDEQECIADHSCILPAGDYRAVFSVDNSMGKTYRLEQAFQVQDSVPPTFMISIKKIVEGAETDVPAGEEEFVNEGLPLVSFGRYKVYITSSEPLTNYTEDSERSPLLSFDFIDSQTFGLVHTDILLSAVEGSNDRQWEGIFMIKATPDYALEEKKIPFNIAAYDKNRQAEGAEINPSSIYLDTLGPQRIPEIYTPPYTPTYTNIDEYWLKGQQFGIYGGVPDASIRIEGRKRARDSWAPIGAVKTVGNPAVEEQVLAGNEIRETGPGYFIIDEGQLGQFAFDPSAVQRYINFFLTPRRTHNTPSHDYFAIDSILDLGDGSRKVNFLPSQQPSIGDSEEMTIYDTPAPPGWFNYIISYLTDRTGEMDKGNNYFRVLEIDGLENEGTPSSAFDIFYDPDSPAIGEMIPRNSTSSNNEFIAPSAQFVEELPASSGMDILSAKCSIDDSEGSAVSTGCLPPVCTSGQDSPFRNEECTISAMIPFKLKNNEYHARITVEDTAGNKAEAEWYFTVDTNTPSTPTVDITGAKKFRGKIYTNNATPKFIITYKENEVINITDITLFNPLASESIELSAANISRYQFEADVPAELQETGKERPYMLTISARSSMGSNAAGEIWSSEGLHTESLVVDLTAPEIEFSQLMPDRTNNNEHTVFGTYVEENMDMVIIDNPEDIQDGVGAEANNLVVPHEFRGELTLMEGLNTVVVTAYDLAGNSESSAINIFVDHEAPVITGITDVSGSVKVDGSVYKTGKDTVTITGQFTSNDDVVVYVEYNEEIRADVDNNNNRFSLDVPVLKDLGREFSNEIILVIEDTVSNTGKYALTIRSDAKIPQITLADPVTGYANSRTPLITVRTDELGAECTISYPVIGGAITGTMSTENSIEFKYQFPALDEASYPLSITCTDLFGNTGTASPILTIDLEPPLISKVSATNARFVLHRFNYDYYLLSKNPFTWLRYSALEPVRCRFIYDNNGSIDEKFPGYDDYVFSAESESGMIPGLESPANYTFIMECEDRASNKAEPYTVDISVDMYLAVNIFDIAPTGWTNEQRPIITLKTDIDSTCTLVEETWATEWIPLYTIFVRDEFEQSVAGDYFEHTYMIATDLAQDNSYSFTAACRDNTGAGREENTVSFAFTADFEAPGIPALDELKEKTMFDSVTVKGRSPEPGLMIELFLDGKLSASQYADSEGSFIFYGIGLEEGPNIVRARAVDFAGNTGALSAPQTITYLAAGATIKYVMPSDGEIKNRVTGITAKFDVSRLGVDFQASSIKVEKDGDPFTGIIFAEGDDTLVFMPDIPFTNGDYKVTLVSVDELGNDASYIFRFTVNDQAPLVELAAPPWYDFISVSRGINLIGSINSTISNVYLDQADIEIQGGRTFNIYKNAALLYTEFDATATAAKDGSYSFTITANTSLGTAAIRNGRFIIDTSGPLPCMDIGEESICLGRGILIGKSPPVSEVSNAELSSCAGIVNEMHRDNCFYELAVKYVDPELCLAIFSTPSRDKCYMQFVREREDYSLCWYISDQSMRTSCRILKGLAGLAGTGVEMTEHEIKGMCGENVWCYHDAVVATGNPSLCPTMMRYWDEDSKDAIDNCHYNTAVNTGDESLCRSIEKDNVRNACLSEFY